MTSQIEKILISIPQSIAIKMRATFPARQRSTIIARLIENEIATREQQLYNCALAVEKDNALNKEMQDWEVTTLDGVNDETW